MSDLEGKKLLVLGGTALSCEIIRQAKAMGAYVMVTDYLEDSPGKKLADKSFMRSTKDVNAIAALIKEEKIDGVLTGFIEWMIPYYREICSKAGLQCYTTKEQNDLTRNKIEFKQLCKKFEVPVVEEYSADKPDEFRYPIIIKPVDNGGGRGINICESAEEFKMAYEKAQSFSSSGQVLIERYMNCKEVTIFYVIKDGEFYLTAMADRHTKNKQGGIIPLPVAYIFPSKHLKTYQETLNDKVIAMFKSIGIQNGMIFIQSFVENGHCIFYEMGFRLTASLEYKIISEINGINPLEMMINHALTGKMAEKDICAYVNPNFKKMGCNVTFLAKPGTIGSIVGIDEAASIPGVIDVVPTYRQGDVIPASALGTLKQVIIRVFAVADLKEELAGIIDKIHNTIKVFSETGENMLLETFDTKEMFD